MIQHPAPRPTTARATEPANLVRLTGHELMTLFHVATPPEAQLTREALLLPALADGDPVLRAGFSSLVLRGLARDERGRLMPVGNLAALCAVLFTATQWTEAVGTVGDQRHAALIVRSPHGSAILESRPTGIWQALPVDPEVATTRAAAGYVAASFGALTGRPFGGVVTVADAHGARTAGVRVDGDGTWTLVHGPVDDLRGPERVAADAAFGLLEEALG